MVTTPTQTFSLTDASANSALDPSMSTMVSFSEWKTMKGKSILSRFAIRYAVMRWYSMALRTRVEPCLQMGSAECRAARRQD